MKLRELEAQFYRFEIRHEPGEFVVGDQATWRERGSPTETRIAPRTYFIPVTTIAEAQGVQFLCPKCFAANGGNVGTHMVMCWFNGRGVPDEMAPKPGRWNPSGAGLDDLTFVGPGAVSVHLTGGGCGWHGFVSNGDAT
jgi:hypothetical protein